MLVQSVADFPLCPVLGRVGECLSLVRNLQAAFPCHRTEFRDVVGVQGLVGKVDGSKVLRTSRDGAATEEDCIRLGREAGEQLKADGGPDFFDWA